MAQHDAKAREQFPCVEGLCQVVVGARVERGDLDVLVAQDGEDQDRHLRPFAQAPEDIDAGDVGQAQVEHDDVRSPERDLIQANLSAVAVPHRESPGLERHAQETADLDLVVNDHHLGLSRFGRHPFGTSSGIRRPR